MILKLKFYLQAKSSLCYYLKTNNLSIVEKYFYALLVVFLIILGQTNIGLKELFMKIQFPSPMTLMLQVLEGSKSCCHHE